MRFAQKTPSTAARLVAVLLTLTATAATAAPARVSPTPRTSATAWVWVQAAWQALTGLSGKEPAIPVAPNRGPGIDPDGSSQAGLDKPRTS